ncbi:hypothetical protein AAMO2058_000231000 [Amorphochlora amoebiformis]
MENTQYDRVDDEDRKDASNLYNSEIGDNYRSFPIASAKRQYTSKRWYILATFSLVAQGNGMIFLALASVSGKAQTFYRVPAEKVNLATILFYAVYVPFMPVATWLVNTGDGLRRCVLVAAFSMAIGMGVRCVATEGNSENFNYLLFGTIIAAINGPFLMEEEGGGEGKGEKERGLATSIGVLANQMGMVVGYLLPPLVVSETEDTPELKRQILILHLTLFLITVVAAILALLIFKSRPEGVRQTDAEGRRGSLGHGERSEMPVFQAIKICACNRDFWVYGLGFSLIAPIYWDMGSLLYQNMHPSGYSDAMIQIPGVLLQAIAIPGMILAGKIIDRSVHLEYLIFISLFMGLAAMMIFTWALTLPNSSSNLALITICACVLGFAFSTVQPAFLQIVSERTSPVPHGYTSSVLYLGTMVIGALYILLGDRMQPFSFMVMCTIICFVVPTASIVTHLVLPTPTIASSSRSHRRHNSGAHQQLSGGIESD